MTSENSRDRYNYEYRKDSDSRLENRCQGQSATPMEYFMIDWEATQLSVSSWCRHLGRKHAVKNESVKKRPQIARETTVQAESLNGQITTLKLTKTVSEGAAGQYRGHQVVVTEANVSDTVFVTLRNRSDTLEGERMRLRECRSIYLE